METVSELTWHAWRCDSNEQFSKDVEEGTADDLQSFIASIVSQFMKHYYLNMNRLQYKDWSMRK